MRWKVIGQNCIGTSHSKSNKSCEDSINYILVNNDEEEVLICCISDGAGSAKYAAEASSFVTKNVIDTLSEWVLKKKEIDENSIVVLGEMLFDKLSEKAMGRKVKLNEFSCTALGCVIFDKRALFFQVGDGAIIREDNNQSYTTIWWPDNGEYSNTTHFLIDDYNLSFLKKVTIEESIKEVAILTDGLQLLTLNSETRSVHQPFFSDLFKWLRLARNQNDIDILNKRLYQYLDSEIINVRTDDDKTLLLATRLGND